MPIPADAILQHLSWRYATKKFDATKRIPDATWSALEQSLILTPSSFGLQPWRFVVITDPAVKAKLPAISWNQTQPQDASHFVVLAARKTLTPADIDHFIATTAKTRNAPVESLTPYKNMMLGTIGKAPAEQLEHWAKHQCYIALGFLMATAALLEVDACPMEGIVHAEYDKLLDLPAKGYTATVGCALGYRAADDKYAAAPKVRYPASEVVLRV